MEGPASVDAEWSGRAAGPLQRGHSKRGAAIKHARAIATVGELCSLSLPSEVFVPALLEAMHAVIPSARNLFDWIDSGGRIERYYFEGAIDSNITAMPTNSMQQRCNMAIPLWLVTERMPR